MTIDDVLSELARQRGERLVVTTMGAVDRWPAYSDGPFDFAFLPSSMGQGTAFALGLALAPALFGRRGVIVLMGDGSLLMNLGSLVTIANHPTDLTVLLLDNGLYEVTGGQALVGAGRTDFVGFARAAGIENVADCTAARALPQMLADLLARPGPRFARLCVEGTLGRKTPQPPHSPTVQIARLRAALGLPTEL